MRFHVSWRGERNILYKKGVKPRREISKRTISASGGFELLQIVSKPITGQCASDDAGPQGRWIVRSHIGWRGERNIPHKGVENSL